MKRITPYFPSGLKYACIGFLGLSAYLMLHGHSGWSLTLILISVLILTTRYVTKIDLNKKHFRDYLSILAIPVNEESRGFRELHKIIITKGNHSPTVNTRVQSRQLDWSDYTGSLIFDEDQSLTLATKNSKKALIKALLPYATYLSIGIEDRTSSEHFSIRLDKY